MYSGPAIIKVLTYMYSQVNFYYNDNEIIY